jgi:LysR family transcriptional regulator, malonate utilization transcriptional regulator
MKARIDDEITFRKLEVLLAFMQTGNLARVAEVLDTTPVSVHRALHSLEAGLRCQLFRNEGRTLVPTRAAYVLAETAEDVVEQMVQGIAKTRQEAGFSAAQIRIGSLYSLTARVVPQILMDLKIRRPSLKVELVLGSNEDLREKLVSGHIDASLMGEEPADGQIENQLLIEDEVYFAVPRSADFQDHELIDLRNFSEADYVSLSGGFVTYDGFRDAFKIAGFEPRVLTKVGDIFSLMSLVAGGVGYTLLPGRVKDVFADRVRLLRLQSSYRMKQRISLMFLRSRERDPNILALGATCRTIGAQLREEDTAPMGSNVHPICRLDTAQD